MSTGTDLEEVLEDSRPRIEAALVKAQAELDELDARKSQLLDLISRAKAALGDMPGTSPAVERPRTLHEAIVLILEESGRESMSVREIAAEVNRRELYRKKDGSPVDPSQIHARTKNYAQLFDKKGPEVSLRQ